MFKVVSEGDLKSQEVTGSQMLEEEKKKIKEQNEGK